MLRSQLAVEQGWGPQREEVTYMNALLMENAGAYVCTIPGRVPMIPSMMGWLQW